MKILIKMFNANFGLDIKADLSLCFLWDCMCQKMLLYCFCNNSIIEVKFCWQTDCCTSLKPNRCGFSSFPGRFLSILKTGNSYYEQDTTFAFSLQNVPSLASLSPSAVGAYRRKKGIFFFFSPWKCSKPSNSYWSEQHFQFSSQLFDNSLWT